MSYGKPFLIYKVTYGGWWLGGKAIVLARNSRQAIKLVREDPLTHNFVNVEAEIIGSTADNLGVLYNDNGDY